MSMLYNTISAELLAVRSLKLGTEEQQGTTVVREPLLNSWAVFEGPRAASLLYCAVPDHS